MRTGTPNLIGLNEKEAANVAKAGGFTLLVDKREGVNCLDIDNVSTKKNSVVKWIVVDIADGAVIKCTV